MARKQDNTLLYIGLAAIVYFMFFKKKTEKENKSGGGAGGSFFSPTNAMAAQSAADAKKIVSDVIENTTFTPDFTTDRDRYKEDQNQCK